MGRREKIFMTKVILYPSTLKGRLVVPPSKSETMRAILFASLAKGKSTLFSPLPSPDVELMKKAVESFGAKIVSENPLQIEGVAGKPHFTKNFIEAGNSGILARFLSPLCALDTIKIVIQGDESIAKRRPIKTLLEALHKRGASYSYLQEKDHFPIWIQGPFSPGKMEVEGKDSQIVSALLITASILEETTEIVVKNPGETPWVEMTLSWLRKMGVFYEQEGFSHFRVKGKVYPSFTHTISADFSSASFFAVACAIQGKAVFSNLSFSEKQGDKILFSWLQEMGASCFFSREGFVVEKGNLTGGIFDINEAIDALPIMAVLGCFTKEGVFLKNGAIARQKESDRIYAISQELRKMGAKIEVGEDFLYSFPSQLQGANLQSHKDHRIAMALIIAALFAQGKTEVEGIECIKKSYPHFLEDLKKMGAKMDIV